MRSTHLWRLVPTAALILLSTGSSMALTLGRAQGVAVLGRPLDVTVPVVLDNAGDDVCPRADVYYGDTRVESRSVELRPQAGQNALMRVQVSRPVDEAFITVQMQVGCTQTLSRRFVLLSEMPLEVAEAAVVPTPVAPAVMPVPTSLPLQSSEPATIAATGSVPQQQPGTAAPVAPRSEAKVATTPRATAAPAAPRASRRTEAAPKPAPRKIAAAPAAVKPATVERPRLKLDTADLGTPAAGGLKSSSSLQSPAAASAPAPVAPAVPVPPQRAEAAAQWQALNAQPEDMLRNAQRMSGLEAEVRAVREAMARNQAMLAELNGRLQQAESERYANGLVYALAALLAGASGLAGWLWIRNRRVVAAAKAGWWSDAADSSEPVLHEEPAPEQPQALFAIAVAGASDAAVQAAGDGAAVPSSAVASVEPAVIPAPAASVEADADSAPTPEEMQSLLASTAAGLPMADSNTALDELKDVAQQAEFFVSLGEYERAIAVLRGQIDAHPQSSALPWLELLALYQQLQRQDEYEQVQRDFEWLFNHRLPASGVAGERMLSLEEGFPEVFAAIQASWGTSEVVERIEDRLLRRPGREASHLIDLAALRELLMLHGVALDHLATGGGSPAQMPGTGERVHSAQHASNAGKESTSASASTSAVEMASSFGELSLDSHPGDGWTKLSASNSRSAALDVNLDDLDHAPAVGAEQSPDALAKSVAVPDANLLDFDLDTGEQFKLPNRS